MTSHDDLDDLQQTVDDLVTRLDQLTDHDPYASLRPLRDAVDDLERQVGDHDLGDLAEEIGELRAKVAHIGTVSDRVRMLERRLRASGTVEVVDLDQWPASCQALVKAVTAGKQAEGRLLDDGRLAALMAETRKPDRVEQALHQHTQAALAAARQLATGNSAERAEWSRAISAWNTAITSRRAAAKSLPGAREDSAQAMLELEAANNQHAAAREVVGAGEAAATALRTRIRTRVSEAVAKDQMFPAWFEAALGPSPAGDPENWITAAVEVVFYRLLFAVTDPVVPLGPRPTAPVSPGWQQRMFASAQRSVQSVRR